MEHDLNDCLHLEVLDSIVAEKSRRITRLKRESNTTTIDVFYEFDRVMPLAENAILDGHVFAVLLYAMSSGVPLRVHGSLSQGFMRNSLEIQLAWRRWKPDIYQTIDILPDRILDSTGTSTNKSAISAFSGGVDATFTALRHTRILPESVRYPLRSLLMVHGFDIDVYNATDFQKLVTRVTPFIEELGIDLRIVRTNSRDLRLQNWDDSFALELAACLHMYADEFRYGLIGSSEAYDALVIPWGSSPITDNLISGDRFSVIHDGAGFSRTDKVAQIRPFETACRTLKVCWAGADQSQNCGRCEKCVRTHLNFLAAGAAKAPPCFLADLDIANIDKIAINNFVQFGELSSISTYAKVRNLSGAWLDVLDARLATWNTQKASISAAGGRRITLKKRAGRLITKMGYEVPAKKVWRYTRRSLLKSLGH